VNWDDQNFILNNPLVDDVSLNHVSTIFSTPESNGGYTPMVLLSWSIDHSINGYNATVFHGTNVLIHLVNVWLVFAFIFLLTGRLNLTVIVTLLFGLHPTCIEAVGWITSRKDLLYGMFYLAGLVVYLKYLVSEKSNAKKLYMLCLLFFLGSLFSKGMAVTFPVSLLLLDYFKGRKRLVKLVVEKLPFFALSLAFGLIAIAGQQKAGAADIQSVSFVESFFVGCYGLVVYIVKAIAPFQLSAYHPYPYGVGEDLPWYIYASVIPVLVIIIGSILVIRKNRTVGFGILFFLCSIVLMLQILPVGLAIFAERFTYIAYIGLFFLIAIGLVRIIEKFKKKQVVIYLVFGVFVGGLGLTSFKRSSVWENGKSLWTDVIDKYPDDFFGYCSRAEYYTSIGNISLSIKGYDEGLKRNRYNYKAYNNRGLMRLRAGQSDSAMADFNRAISLKKDFVNPVINVGLVLMNLNRDQEAIDIFNQGSMIDSLNPLLYFNRGLLYSRNNNLKAALADLDLAITLDNQRVDFYLERANIYAAQNEKALCKSDLKKVLTLSSENAKAHFMIGQLYLDERNLPLAKIEFEKVLENDPNSSDAFTNLGLIHLNQNNYQLALQHLNKSISLNHGDPNNLLNRGLANYFLENYQSAISDFSKCIELAPKYGAAFNWRSLSFNKLKKNKSALDDALQAKYLGFNVSEEYFQSLNEEPHQND